MTSSPVFIENDKIQKLSEAYQIIKNVKENITLEHKGFFTIDAILEKLEDVINTKKFYE